MQGYATSFVGRAEELARLDAAARAVEGVVVVTGPAGVGKSRLVAQWARTEGAVVRADLGAARDLEDALRRIARALELELGPNDAIGRVVERIGQVLGSRRQALWLDDADAVIERLAEPLARWPGPVVLTSRRSRLDRPHTALPLGPLPLDHAVQLLVERARAVRPDFAPSAAQTSALEALARRVDALPLAIELVAPRLRLLSPAQLLARFESAAPTDALRVTLERSFELLQPWERDALCQCAVFRDGFYLEAAEAVLDLSTHAGAPDVLTVLEALVAQSLLRTESAPELPDQVRIRHFNAVREHAWALLQRDETALRAAEQNHLRYFLEASEAWDAGIESPDEAEHTARLVIELPNLEAAHERSSGDSLARLGLVLHMAYQRRGPFARQAELVARIRTTAEQLGDDRLRARAELASARVHRWAGDLARSDEALGRAMTAALAAGDVSLEASCARNLAANRFRAGDLEGFRAHLEHALDAAQRSRRPSDEVNARNGLGYLFAERGEVDRAHAELERALRLAQETRIPGLVALVHGSLSALMLRVERLEEAERHASAAIASYEALGYLRQWAIEHLVRARARFLAGALDGARHDAEAALERAGWLGLESMVASARLVVARIAFLGRDFAAAREAFEQALPHLAQTDPEARRAHAYVAACCAMLGHRAAAEDALAHADGDDELTRTLACFVDRARPIPNARSAEARRVLTLLEGAIAEPRPHLSVLEDGRCFRLDDGPTVDLTRRRALRAVLAGLVAQHRRAPGEPLGVDDVLEAGWPGERMSPESGARRVYVTINRLRNLGLGDLLLTTGDGYMLAPHVALKEG
jgi:predicted ATPase